jgi:hypothetical protein
MHGELVDDAVQWRTNVDTLELVLGFDLLLHQLGRLAADLGKVLADLRAHILIDLENLQLRFGDLALGLGDVCNQLHVRRRAAPFPAQG